MMMDCIERMRVTVRQKGSLNTCLRLMTTSWQLLPAEQCWMMKKKASSSALTAGLFVYSTLGYGSTSSIRTVHQ